MVGIPSATLTVTARILLITSESESAYAKFWLTDALASGYKCASWQAHTQARRLLMAPPDRDRDKYSSSITIMNPKLLTVFRVSPLPPSMGADSEELSRELEHASDYVLLEQRVGVSPATSP